MGGNDFLEIYVKNIEEDTLIVQAPNRVYSNGKVEYNFLKLKNAKFDIEKDLEVMIKENPQYFSLSYPWNKLYSAKIIRENNIRFLEGLRFAEDDRFNSVYFGYVKSMKFIEKGRYYYIVNREGATAQKQNFINNLERYKTNASFYMMIKNRCDCNDFVDDYFKRRLENFIRVVIIDKIYKNKEYTQVQKICELPKEYLSFLQSDLLFRKIDYWFLRNKMPLLFHLFKLSRLKFNK